MARAFIFVAVICFAVAVILSKVGGEFFLPVLGWVALGLGFRVGAELL